MANVDDDLEVDTSEDNPTDSEGMKSLRKALVKSEKERKEAQTELAKQATVNRSRDIGDLLAKVKAPARLGRFAAKDIEGDVTEESVNKWLDENAEDLGWTRPDADDSDDDDADDTAVNARRISQATESAPQAKSSAITVAKLQSMTDAQLIAAGLMNR